MSGQTVRFSGEFDDTKIISGLNSVKSAFQELERSLGAGLSSSGLGELEQQFAAAHQEMEQLEQSTNALEQSFNGLDSASTGISGSFQEIGDAASSTGDNLNSLGTAGETAQQQLESIGTTSVTAGQSMTALGGSADTTATSMGALTNNFAGVTGGLTDANTLVPTLSDHMTDLGDKSESAGSKMQEIWGRGSSIAVGVSAAISGIANLVRGFRDYQDAQLRVHKTTLALSKANEALGKTQAAYNEAVAKYGKDSAEAAATLLDYQQAQEKVANTQEQLTIQTKRAGDAQVDTWLGVAGTVTGAGGAIIQSIDAIAGKKGISGLITSLIGAGGLKGAFTDVGISLGSMGFAGSLGTIADAIMQVAAPIAFLYEIIMTVKTAIEAIPLIPDLFAGQAPQRIKAAQDYWNALKQLPQVGTIIKFIEMLGTKTGDLGKIENATIPTTDKLGQSIKNTGDSATYGGKLADMLAKAHARLSTANDKLKIALETRIKTDDAGAIAEQKAAKAEVDRLEALNNTKPVIDTNVASTNTLTNAIGTGTTTVIKNKGMWIDMSGAINMSGIAIQKSTDVIKPNTAVLKDHGIEVLNATQAQYDWEKTLLAGLQTGTKYSLSIVHVGDSVKGLEDQFVDAGDVIVDVNGMMVDLGKSTDLTSLSEEDFKATVADAIKIQEDYNKTLMDSEQRMTDLAKEGHEYDDMLATLNSVTGQHIMLNDKNIDQMQSLAGALKASRTEYQKQEEAIGVVLDKHKLLTGALRDKILDEKDDRNELNQLIIAHVDWTDALDGSVGGLDLVASGTAKAIMEMDEFTKSAVEGEAKTKALNEMYAELGRTMVGDLHTTVPLTTKDFIELGKSFKDGVPLAEKLAKIVEEDLSPAFETFSEVIQAATRKDFKEAWKGLELGDVGKRFKGELKDILWGMNDIARSGKVVATVISGLVVGALRGMSDKALGQGIKEITEQFNRFKSLDPDASIVQPLINFVNSLPTKDKAAGILAVHQGLEDLATAQATGNITTEQAKKIMGEYTPMIEAYNKAIAAGKSPTDALAIATGQIGAAAETTAGQYDPLQTNILKTATAYDTLVNGIAKATVTFPVPDISPFTTAILTVTTGWDTLAAGIQNAKITFPAAITSTFTKSIDSAYAVFNKMMVGIIQAKYDIAAPNIKPATDAFKSVEVNWKGYANAISKIIPKITVNNSQALSAIKAVQNAMNSVKNVSRTITITTRYVTVGHPAAHNVTGIKAHNITGLGGDGATETPIAALTTGGSSQIINNTNGGGGGQMGDVNITIINKDEFGLEKQRKFKAVLGRDRYVFGSVGAGG